MNWLSHNPSLLDRYDVVIVGSGVVGALTAKAIAERAFMERKQISILLLEAGRGQGLSAPSYASFVERFYGASIKTPNTPYPETPQAPVQQDLPFLYQPRKHYYRQDGDIEFGSNNLRSLGGTTLHWMGIALRMLPSDFAMKTIYDRGVDWPISYDELRPYYEMAEWELGVSADSKDQMQIGGATGDYFGSYEFPMQRIPTSYLDKKLDEWVGKERTFTFGDEEIKVGLVSLPQARNSHPRRCQDPRTYVDLSRKHEDYRPVGAAHDPSTGPGQRCEGNANCIPICPVQAKYSALRTLREVRDLNSKPGIRIDLVDRALAISFDFSTDSGKVNALNCRRYRDDNDVDPQTLRVTGRTFVLAASAIENAKLMLASGAINKSAQLGANLMDHPFTLAWALAKEDVGAFRGPGATSDLPVREGTFRSQFAAFRTDVGNWGWALTDGAPNRDIERAIDLNHSRYKERDRPSYNLIPPKPLFGPDLRKYLREIVRKQFALGFLVEQLPDSKNRVTIDPTWRDSFGNYKPILNYSIDDYTKAGMASAHEFGSAFFHRIDAKPYTEATSEFSIGTPIEFNGKTMKFIGAGHIMGTHRMGASEMSSVVDQYQRSWAHSNLYVMGAGSMPTAGTSNPTLTIAALALRSAETIFAELHLAAR